MTINDFCYLKDDEKIKYIILIQSRTINIIEQIIEIYEKFNMVNLKIDNLLNIFSVYIKNDTFTNYDIEDINTFL